MINIKNAIAPIIPVVVRMVVANAEAVPKRNRQYTVVFTAASLNLSHAYPNVFGPVPKIGFSWNTPCATWKEDEIEGVPDGYGYEKIECMFQGVRDYLKYVKRGLGRTAHLTSIDIRNDRMTREQALKLTKKFDGKRPASLDIFLEYVGMTEPEFLQMAMSHQVAPNKHDPTKTKRGKELWDQKLWDRTKA